MIAGTDPWRWADGLGPLFDTLVGAQHGLLRFVPWTLLVLASAVYARPSLTPPAHASQALFRQIALPLVLYVLLLAVRADPPGSCWGPRYWVAFLPFLALAVVQIAQREGRAFSIALFALALLSVPLALAAAIRYPFVFDRGPVDTLFANPLSSHATSAAAGTAPSATTVSKKR